MRRQQQTKAEDVEVWTAQVAAQRTTELNEMFMKISSLLLLIITLVYHATNAELEQKKTEHIKTHVHN